MKRFLSALLMSISALSANATQEQTFGLGGLSTARVSGLASDPENPFASLSNPALLPWISEASFSFSSQFASVKRDPLYDVKLDDPQFRTRDGKARTGNFEFPSENLSLWAASFQYPFALPRWANRNAGLGLIASGPFGNLRNFRSGTPYDFSTLRYGKSDSQFKGTLAVGSEIIPKKLTFGVGISLFITTGGDADATLLTEDPTARLNLDVGLNTSLVSGFTYRIETSDSLHHLSAVYRQAAAPKFVQQETGTVDLGVGRGPASLPFSIETILYYEPETLELDWQGDYGDFKLAFGMGLQRWSNYQPSFVILKTLDAQRREVVTQTPKVQTKDTWNPRVSVEIPVGKLRLAAGYQFRPTPILNLEDTHNLLDSDTHVLGAGVRWQIEKSEWLPLALGVGLAGQYHLLSAKQVVKQDGRSIGAPYYKYSGNAYNFGILIESTF